MTITPAQFGLDVDNGTDPQHVPLILPAIEAPVEWCDGDPPQGKYHRCRARANVDVAVGDTLSIKYRLDESLPQYWSESHAGAISDAWTSTWANAEETSAHVDHSHSIPSPANPSHRYVSCRVDLYESGAGTPSLPSRPGALPAPP